jgi:hypothetical protein
MSADKNLTEGSQPVDDRNVVGYFSDSMSESSKEQDLLAQHGEDPALSKKMTLVNDVSRACPRLGVWLFADSQGF